VFGQVADVSEASLQKNNVTEPIVTFRLERNDPHAGRIFVASVRLEGGDAVGFADNGDWIEAAGTRKSAHLVASCCINHTTGAVYSQSVALRVAGTAVKAIIVVLVLAGFALAVILVILIVGAAHRFPWGTFR
jgi:hypothetical protein